MTGTDAELADQDADLAGTLELLVAALVGFVAAADAVYGVQYAVLLFALGDPPSFLSAVPTDRTVLHLAAVAALVVATLAGGIRSTREGATVAAVGAPAVAVYVVTGHVLPWDQFAFFVAGSLLDLVYALPVGSRVVAGAVFGAPTLGRATLVRAFCYHYAVLGVGTVAVGRRVVRRGGHRRILGYLTRGSA